MKNIAIKFNNKEEYEYIENILLKNGFRWIGNKMHEKHPYFNILTFSKYFLICNKIIYLSSEAGITNSNYIIVDDVSFFIESRKMGLF